MRVLPASYRPLRIFLDTNAVQALLEHGGSIHENEPYEPGGRSGADEGDVLALRGVMAFGERGAFDFIVSANSLDEVAAAADASFLRWAYDVLDHTQVCLAENPPAPVNAAHIAALDACGYLSVNDARLVRDALLMGCDTFLTVERKLPRNAAHLSRAIGLEVVRPPELMAVLAPHVAAL